MTQTSSIVDYGYTNSEGVHTSSCPRPLALKSAEQRLARSRLFELACDSESATAKLGAPFLGVERTPAKSMVITYRKKAGSSDV